MKKFMPFILIALFVCIFAGGSYYYSRFYKNVQMTQQAKESQEKKQIENEKTSDENGNTDKQSQLQEPEKYEAPDFTLKDLEGNEITLSDYKGKTVILNFWASWCGYCMVEMPEFNELYEQEWKDSEDIVFLSVNMTDGRRETEKKARKVMEDNGFTFPALLDTEQLVAYNYGISSLPITLVIDKEGNLATGNAGAMDKDMIHAMLEGVMQ